MQKDILIQMQEDLEKAIQKSPQERYWAMLIDLRKCVGCEACTVACVSENKLPPKLHYRPVYAYERGKYPNVKRTFLPRPCMQCDKPPCVEACPVKGEKKATWKATQGVEAGIVKVNYAKCIGCGKCVPACPYDARTLDEGKYHSTPDIKDLEPQAYENSSCFEYGKTWSRKSMHQPSGNARKCHFCVHRLANGMLPQCITTCIGRAGYFGDLKDPGSLISKTKESFQSKIQILKKDKKTEPRVFYISDENLGSLYG